MRLNDVRNTKQNVAFMTLEFDRIRCNLPIIYITGTYRRITGHITIRIKTAILRTRFPSYRAENEPFLCRIR